MNKLIAAYTPSSGHLYYPPYINVSSEGADVVITMRGHETPCEGGTVCGVTTSMRIARSEWSDLLREFVKNSVEGLGASAAFQNPAPHSEMSVGK